MAISFIYILFERIVGGYLGKFVINHIITTKKLSSLAFNQYYHEIKKIYCTQGTQICQSGENANCFYLIFICRKNKALL